MDNIYEPLNEPEVFKAGLCQAWVDRFGKGYVRAGNVGVAVCFSFSAKCITSVGAVANLGESTSDEAFVLAYEDFLHGAQRVAVIRYGGTVSVARLPEEKSSGEHTEKIAYEKMPE